MTECGVGAGQKLRVSAIHETHPEGLSIHAVFGWADFRSSLGGETELDHKPEK